MESTRPFEDGARVLHIGPPKTATSSLQGAFHGSRERLSPYGVTYAGRVRHPREAATFAALGKVPVENDERSVAAWEALASEMRGSTDRIVVASSEAFSMASEATIAQIVEKLGGRAEVVLTVRPLGRMLASCWQQRVQNGETRDYDAWLAHVFQRDDERALLARRFWDRYGIDRLARRWASVVGAEHVTVVVLDPTDRSMLLRSFDDLLDVPRGTLVADEETANESLPYPEVEMLRQFSLRFHAQGGTRAEWINVVRCSALAAVRTSSEPLFEAQPIPTPRWAVEAANEACEGWGAFLGGWPGRVVGDTAHLLVDASRFPQETRAPSTVSTRSAGIVADLMYRAARDHYSGVSHRARRAAEIERARARAARRAEAAAAAAAAAQRRRFPARVRAAARALLR